MLKVRPEQFTVLQQYAETEFVHRLAAYVREKHADVIVQLPQGPLSVKEIPEDTLRLMVRQGITRGRKYGVTWESALSAFVTLMFVTAPNYDEHPAVRRVLRDEGIASNSRVNQLWNQVTEQEWETIRKDYAVSAWNL